MNTHELEERGLIVHTGGGTLDEILSKKRKVYLGIDPSADSLHAGNLVPIILMKHLSNMGHTPYLLVGGATGLIGDPKESGERPLLDSKIVAKNAQALKKQMSQILGVKSLTVFNNADWLSKVSLLEFLRDTGKHFTVNQLVKRDIVKRRLETEEDSISFTEFSYPLLQASDYLHLHIQKGIDLQIGGSDQWGNIISGVDLIRRKRNVSTYALTTPIVTDKSTGKKFGKSEGNAVWLDATKTSPFAFYQFWLNVRDESVLEYLKIFTFLPLSEIASIMNEQHTNPHNRGAQKALAREVSKFVHGEKIATTMEKISLLLYSKDFDLASLTADEKKTILKEVPSVQMSKKDAEKGISLIDILIQTELATSKSDARRLLEAHGVSLNDNVASVDSLITTNSFKNGLAIIKRGKKTALVSLK